MGKSGYLPDISGRFNQWTGYGVKCLQMKNYDGARGSLDNMNALLDEEHRITVDSNLYREKLTAEKFFKCNFCTSMETYVTNPGEEAEVLGKKEIATEISFSNVRIFNLKTDFLDSVISGSKTKKVWKCPKCDNINTLSSTRVVKTIREDPSYLGVVPDPPRRSSTNRVGFDSRFREYFNNYAKELENALMNYRIDYIKENGEDMADQQFKDMGD